MSEKPQDTQNLMVINPAKPDIPRFGFYLVDPENENADTDGRVLLYFDTLKINRLIMESELVEPVVADKDFTDKKGRKYKKGDWLFDDDGERLLRPKAERPDITFEEMKKINAIAAKLAYDIFGLDDGLITEDQAVKVIMGFFYHVKKHQGAIEKYSKSFNAAKSQKKKHSCSGAKRGRQRRSHKKSLRR